MKSVLIISYYWPPAGGAGVQRMLKFSKFLPEFGWKPLLLCPENPVYPITDSSLSAEIPKEAEIFRSYAFEPFSSYARLTGKRISEISNPATVLAAEHAGWMPKIGSWVRANLFLPDGRIGWVPFAIEKARKIIREKNPAAILTTGTPHSAHLIGKSLKNTFGIRWIADFRDPWVDIHYNQRLPRQSWAIRWDRALERSVLSEADEVVTVSEQLSELLNQQVRRSYTLIPNGFDPDDFPEKTEPESENSGRVRIHHVGTLPETSVPEHLFRALAQLAPEQRPEMVFTGSVHQRVPELVAAYALQSDVRCEPYLPYTEAAQRMMQADALLLIIPDTEHNRGIVTGKVFNYLGAGRPVILLGPRDGDAARMLHQSGYTAGCEHHDVEGMRHLLKKVTKSWVASEKKKANAAHIATYNRRRQTEQLVALLEGS